ncbi:glycosyltransferase family 4 protein [Haloarcula sp. H-GB4]|uniref:glycosyltransferase family 4 protein n=1 Tax=Haloarcula sp. H-GB4 TaxID=3069755 RepID=UPI0027B565C4|nr:glycosyltransferase family 4 protein [Haloarcula sp. H-GB4]MDQ2072299.1 glycosyltransferase family 4 protein [Haloarcula sp. H-GB4]
MPTDVAIIRGPYFRPNSTLLWEYVHNTYSDIDITGFESDPQWFDTSELNLPIESLHWWDGKIDAFGQENIVYHALEKYKLPSIALTGLRQVVDEHDAVHVTENYRIYSYCVALLCAQTDTTFFVDAHENIPHRPANPLTWVIKKTVNRHADGFTSPTLASKRALIHEGVDPDLVEILPNVVNLDRFQPGPRDADAVSLPAKIESTFNILFVHGLNERKGIPFLLDAFETMQEDCDDISLLLLGENSFDRSYYNEHVRDNPAVYHFEYLEDIQAAYNLSDVLVLPSVAAERWTEQFGRVLVEAMACGLPTVVTDVGGPPFVVEDEETGLVVEPRSSQSLASALTRLYRDEQLLQELGSTAYDHVRDNYSPETVGDDLYEFYRSHCDG